MELLLGGYGVSLTSLIQLKKGSPESSTHQYIVAVLWAIPIIYSKSKSPSLQGKEDELGDGDGEQVDVSCPLIACGDCSTKPFLS